MGADGQGGQAADQPYGLKSKDFAHIDKFEGTFAHYPDWVERMEAKLRRAHPRMSEMLRWAEAQTEPITAQHEAAGSEQGVHVPTVSECLYDILLERTGQGRMDKRRNAGSGRGFELWRVLRTGLRHIICVRTTCASGYLYDAGAL